MSDTETEGLCQLFQIAYLRGIAYNMNLGWDHGGLQILIILTYEVHWKNTTAKISGP